jgi:hypothetical protein
VPLLPEASSLLAVATAMSFEAEITRAIVVATTIHEGCVGETLAALEVAQSAQQVTDEALRAVLETIAEDEARHSELGPHEVVPRPVVNAEPVYEAHVQVNDEGVQCFTTARGRIRTARRSIRRRCDAPSTRSRAFMNSVNASVDHGESRKKRSD